MIWEAPTPKSENLHSLNPPEARAGYQASWFLKTQSPRSTVLVSLVKTPDKSDDDRLNRDHLRMDLLAMHYHVNVLTRSPPVTS